MSGKWSARLSGSLKRAARRAVARAPPPTYSGGCGRVQVPLHTPASESAPDQTDSIRSTRLSISLPRLPKSTPSESYSTLRYPSPTVVCSRPRLMLSTSAMSSASRTGFHSGPSAQSTLAIRFEVRARNIAAAMIGLQLHPCPVAWGSSTLTEGIPRDSPHCASSSAADKSLLCVLGSPCGEAKLNRSTVSNMSNLRLPRRRLQKRGKVGKQRAVDDLDAGAKGVDVVGEQRELGPGHVGGHFKGEAVVLQHSGGVAEVVGEVAEVMDGVAGRSRPRTSGNLLEQLDVRSLHGVDDRRGEFAGSGHGAERQRICQRVDPAIAG